MKCGKGNPDTSKFCTGCGAAIINSVTLIETGKASLTQRGLIITAIVVILFIGAYFAFFRNDRTVVTDATAEVSIQAEGLYPQASLRLLTADDVGNLTQENLRLMRNEIYARHGLVFRNQEMRNYFNNQPWYRPLYDNVSSMLSSIEKSNIKLIKEYENYNEEVGDEYSR